MFFLDPEKSIGVLLFVQQRQQKEIFTRKNRENDFI